VLDYTDLRVRFISALNSLPDKQAITMLEAVYGLSLEYAAITATDRLLENPTVYEPEVDK
jgi:hypothetical protein